MFVWRETLMQASLRCPGERFSVQVGKVEIFQPKPLNWTDVDISSSQSTEKNIFLVPFLTLAVCHFCNNVGWWGMSSWPGRKPALDICKIFAQGTCCLLSFLFLHAPVLGLGLGSTLLCLQVLKTFTSCHHNSYLIGIGTNSNIFMVQMWSRYCISIVVSSCHLVQQMKIKSEHISDN